MNSIKQIIPLAISLIWITGSVFSPLLLSSTDHPAVTIPSQPTVTLPQPAPSAVSGTPRHISIPSIGIDTVINDGYYDTTSGIWTLSETSAYYATPTSLINTEQGSTLIYGHNSTKIFGKLPSIAVGAKATVTTEKGDVFTYSYANSEAVSPNDVGVLQYSGTPRIMVQTCSGLWNQNRQMYYFYLDDYRRAQI